MSLIVALGALGWPAFFVSFRDRTDAEPMGSSVVAEPVEAGASAELLLTPREARATVARQARAIVVALDRGDFETIAEQLGPKGLDVSAHLVPFAPDHFSARSLRGCTSDRTARAWASLNPDARRTCKGYFQDLTAHEDRSRPDWVTYNGDVGTGSERSPLRGSYRGAILVDRLSLPPAGGQHHLLLVFVPGVESWRLAALVARLDD